MLNILLLAVFSILLPILINKLKVGAFIPILIQGAGSFFVSSILLVKLIHVVPKWWELIVAGVIVAIFFDRLSRFLDDSVNPSRFRADIQGIGVYALIFSIILGVYVARN